MSSQSFRLRRLSAVAFAAGCAAALLTGSPASAAVPGTMHRLDHTVDGSDPNDTTEQVVTSADGKWIAFSTNATNVTPGDASRLGDVYLMNRATGALRLVSAAAGGGHSNGNARSPLLSANGRYVVYVSNASDILPAVDADLGIDQVYRYDRVTRTTILVSRSRTGTAPHNRSELPAVSATGRYVSYATVAPSVVNGDRNDREDVVRFDARTGKTIKISNAHTPESPSDQDSFGSDISRDGRYVVFDSRASTLVPDDTDFVSGIFLYDVQTDQFTEISRADDGSPPDHEAITPSMSDSGRYVVYDSTATNLAGGDPSELHNIYLYDRSTGQTSVVSQAEDGTPSDGPSLNAVVNGNFVAFDSQASTLVAGTTLGVEQVYRFDIATGDLDVISRNMSGDPASRPSRNAWASRDGGVVTFTSVASDLVAGDDNGIFDGFYFIAAG
jgi:Tol biopolymer transport system component